MKVYVVKRGGKFMNVSAEYVGDLGQAYLFKTRKDARVSKRPTDRIYRVELKAVNFEKVS